MVFYSPRLLTLSCILFLFFTSTHCIEVQGTTQNYNSRGAISITRHSNCKSGDLMVLFVHRTDDDLPILLSGWKRVASIFKKGNEWKGSTAEDCQTFHKTGFCKTFKNNGGDGHDLAQVAYVKTAGTQTKFNFDLDGGINDKKHPGWAILTCLKGADNNNPIRSWAFNGADGTKYSRFPAVTATAGDLILLSQSYDDKVPQGFFTAPKNYKSIGFVAQSDESAFLFAGTAQGGSTGTPTTGGAGSFANKDALLTLAIRPSGSSTPTPSPRPSPSPSPSTSAPVGGKCGHSGTTNAFTHFCTKACTNGKCVAGEFGLRTCGTCHSSVTRSIRPSTSSSMCGYSKSSKTFKYKCVGGCTAKNGCKVSDGASRHCGTCGRSWSSWIGKTSSATVRIASRETKANGVAGQEVIVLNNQASSATDDDTLAVAAIVIGSVAVFLSLVMVILISTKNTRTKAVDSF